MKIKKPIKEKGFLITFYRCPYCSETFSWFDVRPHIRKCYKKHREEVRKMCSDRAKRNFAEGKILKHIRNKNN